MESVLLFLRRPPEEVETLALDPASRTSRLLASLLLREAYGRDPRIVATDADDVITIFNSIAEEVLGIPREQVLGQRSWRDFFDDETSNCMDLLLTHERFRRLRGFRAR